MKKTRGFTLIELLVVIIIVIIMAGVSVALMQVFFRGQGARQGAVVVTQIFAQCKQLAADQRVVHFMVFTNAADGGRISIYKDANMNKQFDGAAVDPEIPERSIELPKFVNFTKMPTWCGIEPSGYCLFNSGFIDMSAGSFEAACQGPPGDGDIVIQLQNKPYKMCMDIERSSGKIRKAHFLAQ